MILKLNLLSQDMRVINDPLGQTLELCLVLRDFEKVGDGQTDGHTDVPI